MNTLEVRRRLLGRNVYKKTVEGDPAIAQGSLARMYPGITMQGWTEQDGTPTPENPVPIVSAGNWNEETQKWEYEVKLTGANLFNPDGEIVDGSPYDGIPLNNKGIVSMALYEKNQDVDVSNIYFGMCSDELNSNDVLWAISSGNIQRGGKIVSRKNNRYVCWYPGDDTVLQKVLSRYDVMVNYGDGVYLPYHPYKEQTVTLTSERPLTKWDKLEKRNGQWGWVYKSDEIESYTDESVPGEYFSTTGQLSTGAQVWYETTTETFVPLSESEQEQMNALYTFRPTTVLSNDCECEMSLTYKTKKSLEVTT